MNIGLGDESLGLIQLFERKKEGKTIPDRFFTTLLLELVSKKEIHKLAQN